MPELAMTPFTACDASGRC